MKKPTLYDLLQDREHEQHCKNLLKRITRFNVKSVVAREMNYLNLTHE